MQFKSFDSAKIEIGGNVSSIFVVYSAALMRLGIASALRVHASLSGAEIVQAAKIADISDAVKVARRGDVIVCDLATWTSLERDTTGLQAHIREHRIAICLIACTDESAHRLLQLRGVSGVVSTECDGNELELAVSEICEGKTYFKSENRLGAPTGMSKLSCRQIEILELMTRGLLNKQIAWELGVTEGTVKSHVSAILEKLGCDRRTQAIAAFLQSLGVGGAAHQRSLNS